MEEEEEEEAEAQTRAKKRSVRTLDTKTRHYEACVFAGISQVESELNMIRRLRSAGEETDYSTILAAIDRMKEMCKNAQGSSEEASEIARQIEDGDDE